MRGQRHRVLGAFTGIWSATQFSPAAIAISTAYVPPSK
jgi:hypothetical protein